VSSCNGTSDVRTVAVDIFGKIVRFARFLLDIAREINRQLLIDVLDKVRMAHVEACVQDADTDAKSCHSSIPGLDSAHSRVAPLKIKQKV
jgi:hypothetical protein